MQNRKRATVPGIAVGNAFLLPRVSRLRGSLAALRRQGSMASSMVAEATEASVLDSTQDGASSIEEGGSVDGASARCGASPKDAAAAEPCGQRVGCQEA